MNRTELLKVALKAYLAEQKRHSDPLAVTARKAAIAAAIESLAAQEVTA